MRDTFNDNYAKKVLASSTLLLVFYIFLHLSILNYIGCDVVKTLTTIMPNIFKASFKLSLWSLFYFYVGLQTNNYAVYGAILLWQYFNVKIQLTMDSYRGELCPDV